MMEDVPQEWLTRLEAALPPANVGWNENARQVAIVRSLYERENRRGVVRRLMNMLTPVRMPGTMDEPEVLELGRCRVSHILLALRRHRNEIGTWPVSLREIEGQVPAEALIDPLSRKPFVYRVTRRGILVYSVGPNGIDDSSESDTVSRPSDDFPFWP